LWFWKIPAAALWKTNQIQQDNMKVMAADQVSHNDLGLAQYSKSEYRGWSLSIWRR
jgi:hypothetical protein